MISSALTAPTVVTSSSDTSLEILRGYVEAGLRQVSRGGRGVDVHFPDPLALTSAEDLVVRGGVRYARRNHHAQGVRNGADAGPPSTVKMVCPLRFGDDLPPAESISSVVPATSFEGSRSGIRFARRGAWNPPPGPCRPRSGRPKAPALVLHLATDRDPLLFSLCALGVDPIAVPDFHRAVQPDDVVVRGVKSGAGHKEREENQAGSFHVASRFRGHVAGWRQRVRPGLAANS